MVKIILEVNEDFLRERANIDSVLSNAQNKTGIDAFEALAKYLSAKMLADKVDEGVTEFTVSPGKLDVASMRFFDSLLSGACVLAAKSHTDASREADCEVRNDVPDSEA